MNFLYGKDWDRSHDLSALYSVWQHVKLSDVSLGTRPQYKLVVDEDVKKTNKQSMVKTSLHGVERYQPFFLCVWFFFVFIQSRSLDEEVYSISLSLAQRYDLPLWDVYMCHLEFLFSDSG